MGSILHTHNNRYLRLIPRSASHTIAAAWLAEHEEANYLLWQQGGVPHPARYFAEQLLDYQLPQNAELAVVVRNPVERFRSMVAKHDETLEDQLATPLYEALPQLPFTIYFRFEDQLQACASWLGITQTLAQLDPTEPSAKPDLTPEQEARVREIYAADIGLWESLQP